MHNQQNYKQALLTYTECNFLKQMKFISYILLVIVQDILFVKCMFLQQEGNPFFWVDCYLSENKVSLSNHCSVSQKQSFTDKNKLF